MLRANKDVETTNDPDSRLGLGSFGMKSPVLEHFRRITDTDSQYRLALQREEAMGQLEKTATEVKEE